MILAAYDLGDALLTTLAIFFFVIWIWIVITILMDVFRDHELSGWAKAAWVLFLIVIPVVTSLVYLIFRGLNEYAASTPPADEYHATVGGLKKLLRGQLFDYDRLSR